MQWTTVAMPHTGSIYIAVATLSVKSICFVFKREYYTDINSYILYATCLGATSVVAYYMAVTRLVTTPE